MKKNKNNNYKKSSAHPIIEMKNIYVHYKDSLAVRDISIPFYIHKVCALIGPSGCGKSTVLRTLNHMNTLIPGCHIEGEVLFEGENIYDPNRTVKDSVQLRRRIGMVFQKPNPFPKNIYENIAWGARINGYTGNYEELVEHALHQVGLWDEVKDKLRKNALILSGGQQQRLCIARAIAIEPDVILMDEPTAALDPIATGRIEELINRLKQDYTIIIITHNMQQAGRVSDHTACFLMNEDRVGYLSEYGKTKDIFLNPKNPKTEAYISGRIG